MRPPRQLVLSESERARLITRIEEDYSNALGDHRRRMDRFRRYYQKWRARVDPPEAGDEDASNFSVPIIQWQVFQALASEISSLLGDDAEIIAKPVGPSDQKLVQKVGRFETWRMFQSMRITNPLCVFTFRKILFGRSHAYAPYLRNTYPILDDSGQLKEEVDYEGPGFSPLWPDDLIVPAEDAESIHDFSWCIRRYRTTPDEMLRADGVLYQGIEDRFDELVRFAKDWRERDSQGGESIKEEKDLAEGVTFDGALSSGGQLVVHEWYGRWRMLKGKADGREDNLKRRYKLENELVIRFLPDLRWIVGAQDLMEMYPKMAKRRPFVEASLVKDGSYWCQGFGELLESFEEEASANHNLGTDAGQYTVGPVIFFKPAAGLTEEKFKYEPMTMYPTESPQDINVVKIQPDLTYPITKEQSIFALVERITGRSDLSSGRSPDRPNAPKTARGTIALLDAGNVRASLDLTVLREDVGLIASRFWELDSEFAPESVFFRVTEEDAKGLFDVAMGGAYMTAKERGGKYDFQIKFATSVWSRESEKEQFLMLYQLLSVNPLFVTNPQALWVLTNQLCKKFGYNDFAEMVPEPPDMGQPKQPREEWTQALQGEEPQIHPMDNDDLHLLDHTKRLEQSRTDPERDEQAVNLMVAHVLEHQAQKRQKMLMQALTQQLVGSLASNNSQTGGLQMGGVPMPLQNLQQAIGELTGQTDTQTASPPEGGGIA